MYRTKRFQSRITAGRLTLPATILIAVACWLLSGVLLPDLQVRQSEYPLWQAFYDLCIPAWANRLAGFVLYAVMGYFLILLNNTFALIRMRASVQTSVYFLLISACPCIHTLYAGDLAAAAFLVALYFLFRSYQQARPMGSLFHAFVFIGLGSLLLPQLMLFVPVFWMGAYNFQSLQPKSFLASLIGWSVPYWFLLGHAFYYGQMEIFYHPFRELVSFAPVGFDFAPWEQATLGYLLILFIASSAHCLAVGSKGKIRTRNYLQFLILLNFCIFVCIGLQPALAIHLMSFLFIGVGILAGHLFVLTNSRNSNLFFICALVGLFVLFGFNVWTLL
ncbi:hypothetical protein ACMYZ5_05840 [Bacteroides sp. KG68]|uniref:hypothetical protein n=1 Tax=unclassified Bacteroides TaxID=2646097 RepID=UPI003D958D8E